MYFSTVPPCDALDPGGREEAVRGNRLRLAFERQRLHGLGVDGVPDEPVRRLPEEDLERGRGLLEPSRDVDRVAGDEPLSGRRVAGDDLAGVHARPVDEPDAPASLELVVQRRERPLHVRGRADGAQRVVLVERRQPEDRHDRVADVLLDRAAVVLQHRPHLVEVAGQHLSQRLRVERLAEARRALEVGEDDGHRLADLGRGDGRRERCAAIAAQAELRRVLLPTVAANHHVPESRDAVDG